MPRRKGRHPKRRRVRRSTSPLAPDSRARAAKTTTGDYLERLEPLRRDGDLLFVLGLLAPALNLDVARKLRDRGRTARRRALRQTEPMQSPIGVGARIADAGAVFDALAQLGAAVVLAFAAIEAFANEVIELLPETTTVTPPGLRKPVPRDKMARTLGLRDKLELAIQEAEQVQAVGPDSELWASFEGLKDLRDALVHLKERGASNDPDDPSPYGLLLLGEADDAPERAAGIIEALWPGFLPDRVRSVLL
jgi:hypothetical protein